MFPFGNRDNYKRALQFGNSSLREELEGYLCNVYENLLPNAFKALQDGKWNEANSLCNIALELTPENGEAYLGKLMAELRVKEREDLAKEEERFDNRENYKLIARYGDEKLKNEIKGYLLNVRKQVLKRFVCRTGKTIYRVGASILGIALFLVMLPFRILKRIIIALKDTADDWLPIVGIVFKVFFGITAIIFVILIIYFVIRIIYIACTENNEIALFFRCLLIAAAGALQSLLRNR